MNLEKIKNWVNPTLKIVSILAIICAGAWAIYQFDIAETTSWNTELSLSTEVLPYADDKKLLVIHIKPKNIGKVEIDPEHLRVSVANIPANLSTGVVNLDMLKVWFSKDVLSNYQDGYEMEPGVEYDEVIALVVPQHTTYLINSIIELDKETNVNQQAIVRVD